MHGQGTAWGIPAQCTHDAYDVHLPEIVSCRKTEKHVAFPTFFSLHEPASLRKVDSPINPKSPLLIIRRISNHMYCGLRGCDHMVRGVLASLSHMVQGNPTRSHGKALSPTEPQC